MDWSGDGYLSLIKILLESRQSRRFRVEYLKVLEQEDFEKLVAFSNKASIKPARSTIPAFRWRNEWMNAAYYRLGDAK